MSRDSKETDRSLSRRQYVAVLSASSVALAGCGGGGGDDGDDDSTDETGSEDGGDGGTGEDDSSETAGTDSEGGSDGGDENTQGQDGNSGIEPLTFSGNGSESGETVQMQDGLAVGEASHGGTGQFRITLEGGQFPRALASGEGGYEGKGATYTENREYTLNVVADGSWNLTIRQPRADSAETPPVSFEGSGSDVVGPVNFAEDGTARFSHDGEFAVAVTFYPQVIDTAAPLLNGFGEFDDETVYPSRGISWVDIDADGSWTLEFE
jgi:hypothetical protein